MVWKLGLLGRGHLSRDGAVVRLERKTAALFAYLALEGPTSRTRLAGLLWPDSTEAAARSSLRQRLYRLRASVGADLVVSEEPLRLDSNLEVDAVRLEALVFTNQNAGALELEGGLLEGNDYDDCPDLAEWVLAARERLEGIRREALSTEAKRLEAAGDYAAALAPAERLVARDPISEDAHRRVMRLCYLAGDRPAALRAFERCRATLQTQLGLEPLAETLHLAGLILRGDGLPQSVPLARASIPVQVLRPPLLAGREGEWAQLVAAWEAGLGVMVRGEPGVGKTRLMLDFVGARGEYVLLEGRPGDQGVPYAALARGLRRALGLYPNIQLEPWVKLELSRILPELGEAPLVQSEAQTLRFFRALVLLLGQLARGGVQAVVADDLQFMDAASLEAWTYLVAQLTGGNSESTLHLWCGFRTGELGAAAEARLLQGAQDGQTLLIELGPLGAEGIGVLLHSLELPGAIPLSASLFQYTGGNPLYVLETLKSLLETGGIERGLPAHFPPPRKIGALIGQRLLGLSPGALRLARVAAVAASDFSLELAAHILGVSPLELAGPLAELESAQVIRGTAFVHDLIYETTIAGIPAPVKSLLYQSVGQWLEHHNANPANIARHYLEAGQEARAIPFLLGAARLSAANFQLREATAFFERAATALEQQGQRDQAFQALSEARKLLAKAEVGERLEQMIAKLASLATTPTEQAQVALARAEMLYNKGDMPGAERAAREGCKLSQDKKLYFELLAYVAGALAEQNKLGEATALFEQCLAFFLEQNDQPMVQRALGNVAYIYGMQGRRTEATQKLEQQLEIALRLGDLEQQAACFNGLMFNYYMLGLLGDGLQKGEQALELYNRLDGQDYERCRTLAHIANCARDLNSYQRALECIQQATGLSQQTNLPNAYVHRAKAATLIQLGDTDAAQKLLQATLQDPRLTASDRRTLEMTYLFSLVPQTGEFEQQLAKVGELVKGQSPFGECRFWLEGARDARLALEYLEQAHELIQRHGFAVLGIIAHARKGVALLSLGRVVEALKVSTAATQLLKTHTPSDCYKGEVYLSHYQILKAAKKKTAPAYLGQTLAWLTEVAAKVPGEYRNSFLMHNPINAAILEAARKAGLELPQIVTLQ